MVLDSSLIIAATEATNANHEKAKKFLEDNMGRTLYVSTLGIAEVLTGPMRHSKERAALMELQLKSLVDVVVEVNLEIARKVASLKASHKLTTSDAVMAATAEFTKKELVTFDKELARKYKKARLL